MTRPWRIALGALAAFIVLAAVYSCWLVWQVEKHLTAASDAAHALQTAVRAGDEEAIESEFATFAAESKVADHRTDGPMWGLMTHLPGFGDDAHGIRTVSHVAADLGNGSLKDLAGKLADLDKLAPQGGSIDLKAVEGLQAPVRGGARDLTAASKALAAEDPSGFVESLKLKFRDLQRQVVDVQRGLSAAQDAVDVMPAMLGADGPKKYLLVMQNNAEVRATGGLPGAVSVLEARDGKIAMVRQVAGNSLGMAPKPVLPLTNGEINAYGDIVGTFFLDANLQPDWGRASDLMAARWKQVFGEHIDGVLSVDPIALSYLLGALGPVTVDGHVISADTAVPYLLNQVYIDFPAPAAQDAFFRKVAASIFLKITGAGTKASTLMPALERATSERRILVHSFDKTVQSVLAGSAIAGTVEGLTDDPDYKPGPNPQIGVYINEGSSSKMSYYLRMKLNVQATSCVGGVQTYSAHLTVSNTATAAEVKSLPTYVTGNGETNPKGETDPIIQIVGPTDGLVGRLQIAGRPVSFQADIADDRRPVKQVWMALGPGETQDVTWKMKSGKGQAGESALSVTPTTQAGTEPAQLNSAC